MPDISVYRLEDLIRVPESARVDEVRDVSHLLLQSNGLLELRNVQNRQLNQAYLNACSRAASTFRKARQARIRANVVITTLLAIIIAIAILV